MAGGRFRPYRVQLKQTVTVDYEVVARTLADATQRLRGWEPVNEAALAVPPDPDIMVLSVGSIMRVPTKPRQIRLSFPELVRSLVNVAGPQECWGWLGTINGAGYGQFSFGRRSYIAHRTVYELEVGPIAEGLQVCHRCDVRSCCNYVSHLFLGTAAENQHDKAAKGRAARGEQNGGGGKLTRADVLAIRQRVAAGESNKDVAERFGVSRTMIGFIINGKAWTHV